MLHILELRYNSPVDVEFTLHVEQQEDGSVDVKITILQCRPQSHMELEEVPPIPKDLFDDDIFFSTCFVVPQGYIEHINRIVYVDPTPYFSLPTINDRFELGHAIGRVNELMKNTPYLLIGPGRWGSSNSDLGVPINYGDIVNSDALIELTGPGIGLAPEPSLGTHFFQDLMEAHIYPLAVDMEDSRSIFRADWLDKVPNHLLEYSPSDQRFADCLKVIHVDELRPGSFLRVIMSDEKGLAVAFLTNDDDYLIG